MNIIIIIILILLLVLVTRIEPFIPIMRTSDYSYHEVMIPVHKRTYYRTIGKNVPLTDYEYLFPVSNPETART